MIKHFPSFVLLSFILLFFSCQTEPKSAEENSGALSIGHQQFTLQTGPDCEKVDSLRNNCLSIELSWPKLESGSQALQDSVTAWSQAYLTSMLAPETSIDSASLIPVEKAAQQMVEMHRQFGVEAPDSPMGQWTAESYDTVLLNDGRYLSLQISGFVYAGGAHGSPTAAVVSFDSSGRRLGWDDLVSDQAALKTMAEEKFREEQAEAFADGFQFDETFPFTLPQNFALLAEGIYFHYVPYEVGPYAMGSTVFVLPYEKLGAILKIKKI